MSYKGAVIIDGLEEASVYGADWQVVWNTTVQYGMQYVADAIDNNQKFSMTINAEKEYNA